MQTQCTQKSLPFHPHYRREVVARFNGGSISSDGGGVLLREADKCTGIVTALGRCFTDHRNAALIEHTVEELVGQRIYGLALGYEDLNDHDDLRRDPLLATLVGKADPTGQDRPRRRDAGKALAGKSTLNRLELTEACAGPASRYKKIVADGGAIERMLVDVFVQGHDTPPERIVVDLDATDDPLHGHQEGRFFHGYYGQYCYLPLYITCGEFVLAAKLRPSNIDASAGAVEEVERIVAQIRQSWPDVEIVIRADSGFARDELMAWCEGHGVDYVLGLARNSRLTRALAKQLRQAKRRHEQTGRPERVYRDFTYRTLKTWSRRRRVVGKAEHLAGKSNPRFVVTSIPKDNMDARRLYEDEYCARGDMENRIKEQQLGLFADRTSTATMRANQLRLWFSTVAYLLMQALRRLGLKGTSLEKAQCSTIRVKLLKIGAQVRVTVRKIWVSLASGSPYAGEFTEAWRHLQELAPKRC